MTLELPDIVIKTLIKALNDGILIQKQARLCDLAALDFIPTEILPHLKLHHQKAIALSPATSQRILSDLAKSKNRKVKLTILKNIRISSLVLVVLSKDTDSEIRRLVLTHEQAPGEILIRYKEDYPWRYSNGRDCIFTKAASAKSTNPEVLKQLSNNEDWRVRQSVAGNPKTPIDILKILAKDTFWNTATGTPFVRREVAENPSTPLDLLEELANDFNQSVREGVSLNPQVPLYLLEELAKRSERHVLLNILKNPSTPSHVIEIVFCSITNSICHLINKQKSNNRPGGQYLALIAKHRNTPPKILQSFFDNNFGYRALAENSSTPQKILVELANSSENDIREKIAQNSSTPRKTLFALSKDKSKHVQISIANNPNAPSILLRRLSKLDSDINIKYIQKALAQNPSTPTDILEKLAEHRDFFLKSAVAKNISTPLYVLEDISRCGIRQVKTAALNRIRLIYQNIAANPAASIEQLQEMTKHQNVEVRLAVTQHPQGLSWLLDRCLKPERCLPEQNSLNRVLAGMHPEMSEQQIDNLFYSDNLLDRLSVACNSNLSEECLRQLAQDENDVVKQAAQKLLSKRQN